MAFSAKSGTGHLLFLQELFVTAHALLMEGLFQIRPGVRSMAGRTANPRVSLLQLALVKDIFPLFVNVMTILAREPGFDMAMVREGNRGSSLLPKVLRMIQDDLVRLRLQRRSIPDRQRSDQNHQTQEPFPFHARFPPEDALFHLTTSFPRRFHPAGDRRPGTGRCSGRKQSCWEHGRLSDNNSGRRAHSSSTRFP